MRFTVREGPGRPGRTLTIDFDAWIEALGRQKGLDAGRLAYLRDGARLIESVRRECEGLPGADESLDTASQLLAVHQEAFDAAREILRHAPIGAPWGARSFTTDPEMGEIVAQGASHKAEAIIGRIARASPCSDPNTAKEAL